LGGIEGYRSRKWTSTLRSSQPPPDLALTMINM
jgi:hypothetical protein